MHYSSLLQALPPVMSTFRRAVQGVVAVAAPAPPPHTLPQLPAEAATVQAAAAAAAVDAGEPTIVINQPRRQKEEHCLQGASSKEQQQLQQEGKQAELGVKGPKQQVKADAVLVGNVPSIVLQLYEDAGPAAVAALTRLQQLTGCSWSDSSTELLPVGAGGTRDPRTACPSLLSEAAAWERLRGFIWGEQQGHDVGCREIGILEDTGVTNSSSTNGDFCSTADISANSSSSIPQRRRAMPPALVSFKDQR